MSCSPWLIDENKGVQWKNARLFHHFLLQAKHRWLLCCSNNFYCARIRSCAGVIFTKNLWPLQLYLRVQEVVTIFFCLHIWNNAGIEYAEYRHGIWLIYLIYSYTWLSQDMFGPFQDHREFLDWIEPISGSWLEGVVYVSPSMTGNRFEF